MSPELFRSLAPILFGGLVIVAALTDLVTFTIPNWISVALAVAFAPAAFAAHVSLPDIGISLAVGLAVLAAAAGMFALGWVGGGDAKLMTAAALWLGLKGLVPFLIFTALAGGALAVALLGLRSAWLRPIAHAGPNWARRLATPGESAPYGVAIAAGALAAFAFATHPLV